MAKLKDIFNRDHNCFAVYAAVITVLFLAKVLFFGQNNMIRWVKSSAQLRAQRRQIEQLAKEIDNMDQQVRMLSNDKDSLERFARETFFFAAPGDDVYLDRK